MPQFTDIYLYIRPDQYRYDNCRATVSGDGDVLDMIEPHINSYHLYGDDACTVAKVRLDRNTPYRFRRLGLAAVEELTPEALQDSYLRESVFLSLEDLLIAHPELDDVKTWVDEEGIEHFAPLVTDTTIA